MDRKIKTILFDFDYTIADSSKGVFECINFALDELGFEKVSYEQACRTIGYSLPETLVKLVGKNHGINADEFSQRFKEKADLVMCDKTVLFEAVHETMKRLRINCLKLGIVSTKYRYRIESILRRDNLLDFYDVIVGGEDVKAHKPDPQGLEAAIKQLNAKPSETLYVGDSLVDAETARNAGVDFVAVLSGVTPETDFAPNMMLGIIDRIADLPKLLKC